MESSREMLSRNEISELHVGLDASSKIEAVVGYWLSRAVYKTRRALKNEVEAIREKLDEFNAAARALQLQFCKKDEAGKPLTEKIPKVDRRGNIVVSDGKAILEDGYCGLAGCSEYEEELVKINKERRTYLAEEIEIEIYQVEEKDIPKKDDIPHSLMILHALIK